MCCGDNGGLHPSNRSGRKEKRVKLESIQKTESAGLGDGLVI